MLTMISVLELALTAGVVCNVKFYICLWLQELKQLCLRSQNSSSQESGFWTPWNLFMVSVRTKSWVKVPHPQGLSIYVLYVVYLGGFREMWVWACRVPHSCVFWEYPNLFPVYTSSGSLWYTVSKFNYFYSQVLWSNHCWSQKNLLVCQ